MKKLNNKTLRLLTSCIVILSFGCSLQPDLKNSQQEMVISEMNALQQQYNLPSLSIAISIDDKIVFANAIGYADIEKNRLATVDTQYSVGSLAKPMTGIALIKLVDSNKVSLNSPVSEYVKKPDYTYSFTIKELASHIAGVPHDTPERDIAEFINTKNYFSPFEAFGVFDNHSLLFEPGTDYKYSSNGYILLSAVIEQAANMNYVDFLKSSLWTKLDMKSTEHDTSFAGRKEEATYYAEFTDSSKHVKSSSKRDRSFLFGAGGFISTPTDLVKMSKATYSENYLSTESRKLFFTPTNYKNGEMNTDKYSIGWRVGAIKLNNEDESTWLALHHGGVTDNASTAYLFVIPECKAAIAFTTNYVPDKFWRMRGKMV